VYRSRPQFWVFMRAAMYILAKENSIRVVNNNSHKGDSDLDLINVRCYVWSRMLLRG
jgi:hypothetical protein